MTSGRIFKVLKWVGIALGGLVGVLVVLILVLLFIGGSRVNKTYDVTVAGVTVPTDANSAARGEHIVRSYGLCVECHGEKLEGELLDEDPVFGRIAPSNLTGGLGGVGGDYSNADWVRAIRHGIGNDGKPLVVMPSQYFNKFSDQDLGDIVAYLKSLPPVDNDLAKTKMKFLGQIITVLDSEILPASMIDHEAPRPASPAKGVTKEYGEYLATVCMACHGEHLSGGPLPGEGGDAPVASNLTHLAVSDWSEADFDKAVRTGVTPFRKLDQEFMPWETLANLTDDEVTAL